MATIETINSSDVLEPTSRVKINDNFSAQNTELATLLPKAGGTMTGVINMGNQKIINLAAPTSAGDAARKADVDGYVIPDASVSDEKLPHDTWIRKKYITFTLAVGTMPPEYRVLRPGVVTGISIYTSSHDATAEQPYADGVSAATGKFSAGDRIGFSRNTSTGVCYPRISGTNINPLGLGDSNWAAETLNVMIEFEFDDTVVSP